VSDVKDQWEPLQIPEGNRKVVAIPAEQQLGENRAAISPVTVERLVKQGFAVRVQRGAGLRAGYDDLLLNKAGAAVSVRVPRRRLAPACATHRPLRRLPSQIVESLADLFKGATVVAKVNELLPEEAQLLDQGTVVISFFNPANKLVSALHCTRARGRGAGSRMARGGERNILELV
jgi:NAD/NADP transhydrogenase alpha subunit